MKCPRCDGGIVGEVVGEHSCYDCGLYEDSQEYENAVNFLLTDAAEEDDGAEMVGSQEKSPKFPAPVIFVCCECTCADFEYRQGFITLASHFASRFVSAQQVGVSSFDRDKLGNIIARTLTDSGHAQEVTMTFDSGEPTTWICKHIIAAMRLWVRREHEAQHVLLHWQGDEEVAKRLKWAKHQLKDAFQPVWYRLDRNVFIVVWND